jgi:uncharacterized cupredoxin-like copper-binding protein
MRRSAILALLALSLLPAAQAASVTLSIEARETGCPSGHTYCFVVTQGNLADLKAGVQATVTFANKGNIPHELKVLNVADADATHKGSKEDKAIASSKEDLPAGATDTFSFTVPAGAAGVYMFCGVSGHEQLGMWLDSTSAAKGTPGPELGLLVAALAAVGLSARRRGS